MNPTPSDVYPPCRSDPDLFFDERNDRRIAAAKAVCFGCSFRAPCDSYALAHAVEGVWAGTTTDERQAARKRARIVAIPIVTNPYPHRRQVAS